MKQVLIDIFVRAGGFCIVLFMAVHVLFANEDKETLW